MAEIFRFVDSAGALRLDLLSETGWILGRGLDLGKSSTERLYLGQPPYDGAVLAATYRGVVTMRVPLLLTPLGAATRASMKSLFDALAVELSRHTNYIQYRPDGFGTEGLGTYTLYTYKSDVPTLMAALPTPSPFYMKRGGVVLDIDRAPNMTGAGGSI